MTASFLATAMTALLWPRVFASFIPQALSGEHWLLRVIIEFAATYNVDRTLASPALEM